MPTRARPQRLTSEPEKSSFPAGEAVAGPIHAFRRPPISAALVRACISNDSETREARAGLFTLPTSVRRERARECQPQHMLRFKTYGESREEFDTDEGKATRTGDTTQSAADSARWKLCEHFGDEPQQAYRL